MAIFKEALNPFGKVFGNMSEAGRNNTYANAVMFNAMGNKLAEGRQLAAANNLSYGGVDDQGEHIFAPAGVYQPIQEAAEGIAGLLDSRPPEMLPIPPIDPNLPVIGGPLPEPPEMLPPPIYDFDYPDPNPPANSQVTDPSFQQPITDDPYQYAQPDTRPPSVQVRDPMTEIPGPGRDPIFFEEVIPDPPIQPDPPMVVQGEVPGAGYIEDPVPFGAPMATATPIGQPIDTGTNPFYAGATNVAQPPSMTPVAPSFSLDVGMGGGGFNVPTPPTNRLDYFDNRAATVPYPSTTSTPTSTPILPNEPQTTTTALPTVNSFAGFNGFGGFGGF